MKATITMRLTLAATLVLGLLLLTASQWKQTTAHAATRTAQAVPTFAHDVAPIIYENCVTCHRPGQSAPFSLISYQDISTRAKQIAAVTESRYMPPWKAKPGYGDFHGARLLSTAQIATLATWAKTGTPEGNAAEIPTPPQFTSDWQLGKPDLVVTMPTAFTVPADGPDVYKRFQVPVPTDALKYVTAIEFRPSDPKVVHHAILYLSHNSDGAGKRSLPSAILGAWVPGTVPQFLPDGVARPLPANSAIEIQTHFHPTGKPETEQSQVGLYFAKETPKKLVAGLVGASFSLAIPPGDKNYVARDSFVIPVDVEAISIQPHAHLLCRDVRVTATLPDGTKKPMIWIPDWDFSWQGAYQYAQPMHLPKGTRVDTVYSYDNSADNFRNPNSPPHMVYFGEQTVDEMSLTGIEVVPDNEADVPALKQAVMGHLVAQYLIARALNPTIHL